MNFSLSRISFGSVALQTIAVLLLFWCVSKGEVLSAFVIFITSMVVAFTTVKNIVLPKRCHLSCLMYVLVSSSLFLPTISESLAGLFFSLSIWNICRSFRRELALNNAFRVGFFLSLASFYAFEAIFLIPCLIMGMWIFKRTPREVIIAIAGFLLPLFAVSYINWGFRDLGFFDFFVNGYNSVGWGGCQCVTIYEHGYSGLIFLCFLCFNLLLALLHGYLGKKQARRRSERFNFFFMLLTLFMLAIFFFSSSRAIYSLMAVPIAVLLPLYYLRAQGLLPKFIYFTLILLGALVHLSSVKHLLPDF